MAKRKPAVTLDSFFESKKPKMNEDQKSDKIFGHWQDIGEDMLIFSSDPTEHRNKIFGVDLDGTIITTQSGKVFPQNESDWRFLYPVIPEILKEQHLDGYKVVVFTNQKGIQKGNVDVRGFKRKIENICLHLGIPIQVFVSKGSLRYRKPCIGMWDYLENKENGGVAISRSDSIYVGDAAGRIPTKDRRKDFSAADRLFALNLSVKFFTPEEFFLRKKEKEQFILPAFNPPAFLEIQRNRFEPADTPLPGSCQEIIVLVGFPGCGKSKLAAELENEHNYGVVNRDTMKTWQKCIESAKVYLKRGQNVVVDNTNYDIISRKRYIDLSKAHHVQCRCFYFVCDIAQATHHCKYRVLAGTDLLHAEVGTMVLRMFKSKFQEPKLDEGFSSIVRVNFVPNFEKESLRDLYRLYLCDT